MQFATVLVTLTDVSKTFNIDLETLKARREMYYK